MKKIGVLTSSRADYGIYLPLLKSLENNPNFNLKLIVFGTHLSPFHGFTINQIIEDGFKVDYQIESMLAGNSPNAISTAMALTSLKFADFWKYFNQEFDLVFCLGDRYEMFAAVISGIPFGIKYAHLYGGEKTLGAIDHFFRHSISLASKYHFVSCDANAHRVAELIESENNIFNIGSLSLDKLDSYPLLDIAEFKDQFDFDLTKPTILVTVHPETIFPDNNSHNIQELIKALIELDNYQILITLPNADTNSSVIREKLLKLSDQSNGRIRCYENLGYRGYFTAMKFCSFLLGNTSSGIIEAASFQKMVINLGTRQLGREQSSNVINSPFDHNIILESVKIIENDLIYKGTNIYYKKDVAQKICSILKDL